MRAGLYARVSRKEQAEEGYSIEAQLDAMRSFCQDRDWEVAGEFIEPGVSGTTDERPALQDALRVCEAGVLDVLVTHRLDRFFRNLQLQLETLAQLGRWGVSYVSTTEQLDYSTPQGAMFMQMLGAFNEYYSANLGREVRKGKTARARAGLSNSSLTNFGYQRVDGQDVIDEDQAAGVLLAFETYATGEYSDQGVADLLNREGCPPPAWRADRWLVGTTRHMLMNQFYIGEVEYRGKWFPGKHQAIISQELWEQVQEARRRRSKSGGGPRTGKVYLLHRVAHCWRCRLPLYMNDCRGLLYYLDAARARGVDCPTAGRGVPMGILDRQVAALVERLRLPEDWRERLEELANHQEERQEVEGKRKYLKGKLRRLRELYVEGDLDRREYDRERADLQAKLDALHVPDRPDVEQAGETLESLGREWASAPKRIQRDMLAVIFEAVYVDIAARRVVCVKPYQQFAPLFRMDGTEEKEDGCFYCKEDEEAGSEN